jgi:hypothetical protein
MNHPSGLRPQQKELNRSKQREQSFRCQSLLSLLSPLSPVQTFVCRQFGWILFAFIRVHLRLNPCVFFRVVRVFRGSLFQTGWKPVLLEVTGQDGDECFCPGEH